MKSLLKKLPHWMIAGLSIFPVLMLMGVLLFSISAGKVNILFWMVIPSIIFEEMLESSFYTISNNVFLNLLFVLMFWFTIGAGVAIISKFLKKLKCLK